MTVTEAARELGLSVSALRTRVEKGYIKAERAGARLWLIPTEEVEKWREKGKLKAWEGRRLRERRSVMDPSRAFTAIQPSSDGPDLPDAVEAGRSAPQPDEDLATSRE